MQHPDYNQKGIHITITRFSLNLSGFSLGGVIAKLKAAVKSTIELSRDLNQRPFTWPTG